jgi:RNA polymerase sigma-70 factor, ECF subfamily
MKTGAFSFPPSIRDSRFSIRLPSLYCFPGDMDERALVERLIARDSAAWDRFVREYGPTLVRAAAVVSPRDAEDVAQKVCAMLLEADARLLRSFRGQSTFSTWLIGIVRNQALMQLRRDKLGAALPPREPPKGRGPLEDLMAAENEEQLAAALAAIPPRDRLLLTLHYLDELPHARIAAVLGIAVNSVGPLLDRARERLKKKSH